MLEIDIVIEQEDHSLEGKSFWKGAEEDKIQADSWQNTDGLDDEWKAAKNTKTGKQYFKQLDSEVSALETKMQKMLKSFEKDHPEYKVTHPSRHKNATSSVSL